MGGAHTPGRFPCPSSPAFISQLSVKWERYKQRNDNGAAQQACDGEMPLVPQAPSLSLGWDVQDRAVVRRERMGRKGGVFKKHRSQHLH